MNETETAILVLNGLATTMEHVYPTIEHPYPASYQGFKSDEQRKCPLCSLERYIGGLEKEQWNKRKAEK